MSGKFLTEVLKASEHIQELIEQSAKELSSVTAGGKHEPAAGVTKQLQDASKELTAVTQALRIGIRDRTLVDHQLAAAVEQEESFRKAALHDQLTGLPNRVLFRDRLEHGIAQATRHGCILAVMFVDLDDFKAINDTYGHQAGDAVLQTIATRLRQSTRGADTVSRYGGDEFLYLLDQIREENDIGIVAAKILKAIQAPCHFTVGDAIADPCMNASIGIAIFPRDGATASDLIKRADEAMYVAKETKSGFAMARSGAAALCAASHGRPIKNGVPFIDAPRISDGQSSTGDQPL